MERIVCQSVIFVGERENGNGLRYGDADIGRRAHGNGTVSESVREQIKITVTSRANEYATAECTVDYARRITDFTFYSFSDNQQAPGFGKDEILVDMVIPSADDLFSSEEIVITELKSVVLFTAGDPEVEGVDIYDEDIARTYQFSDYTIKDCKIATDLENSDGLGATVEITWEYNRDFGNLLSACASFCLYVFLRVMNCQSL